MMAKKGEKIKRIMQTVLKTGKALRPTKLTSAEDKAAYEQYKKKIKKMGGTVATEAEYAVIRSRMRKPARPVIKAEERKKEKKAKFGAGLIKYAQRTGAPKTK
jgi:hypothetical protein